MLAAIVQARMTSTRLPGKVLKEVMGRPLLWYLVERLRMVDNIEKIIIATTTNKEDNLIIKFCEKTELDYYRGSENDVLDRYYQTAKLFGVEHVMRITSDCPLIDPRICDRVIKEYLSSHADYVHTGPTFAEGVDCEILSFKALEKAWREAGLMSEREHITLYIHNHPELFRKITLTNKTNDSKYRFTVDEQEDFLVVKAMLEGLYKENSPPFTTEEIKDFLDTRQDIFMLNAHIVRNQGLLKSLKEDGIVNG
jgi:spore coat polysaccharide biosynthesis protein SpsF